MSKKILPFRLASPNLVDPPRPVNADPDDEFLRLDMADNLYSHMGFFEGAVFVAQVGRVMDGHLHYVEIDGCGLLARLAESTSETMHVYPLDRVTPARNVRRVELARAAVIVEMYPIGLQGSRWILFPKEDIGKERPFFDAVAN